VKIQGLALLDVRGLLMHAYHRGTDPDAKLSPLTDKPVNTAGFGLRGFLDTYLIPLLHDFSPLNIIAVWDGGNNYREGLFAGYKAKRHAREKDPAVEAQLTKMLDMAKALLAYSGAFNVRVEGVEADDVIGAFCLHFPEVYKLVHTVDGDLTQLIDDNTVVFVKNMPASDFAGYPTRYVRLYKSLVGDDTDEYGGVPQVGVVAFAFLVKEYGFDGLLQLERCVASNDYTELLEAVEATDCKVLKKIYEGRNTWRLMYTLAGLHPELLYGTLGKKIIRPEWYVRLPDATKVQDLLKMAGDPTLFEHFAPHMPTMTLVTPDNWEVVHAAYVQSLPDTPLASFDYETYDSLGHDWSKALPDTARGYVDVLSARLTGGSFTYGANLQHTFYLPVLHKNTANLDKSRLVDLLVDIENAGLDFVAHNARFEEQVTKQDLHFQLEGPVCTQMLGSYVDENLEQGLKAHARQWLKYDQVEYSTLMAQFAARDMRDLTGEQVLHYACDDAFVAARLAVLFSFILKLEKQWKFAYEEDRFTVHPFNRSFETGVQLDNPRLQELDKADALVVTNNTETLHGLLAKHCNEISDVGAEGLKKAEADNLLKLHLHDKLNRAQAQAKVAETYERWRQGSVYRPYCETFTPAEFIATDKGFTRVAEKVGLPVVMEGVSAKGITAWLVASQNYLKQRGSVEPRAAMLIARVLAASGEIRKREGEQFIALKRFIETEIIHQDGVREITGDELNLNSPKQMQELLYCKLQLPVRLRTFPQKGSRRDELGLEGNPGTDKDAMQAAIAEDCPEGDWRREVLQLLIETKECMTRQSLYYAKYPHWRHPSTGVVHPGTRNNATKTRRPAGSSLNILAVSKGPLRSIFIPRFKGHVIVALDFSGQELRITGSESRDPVLISAYTGGGTRVDEDGMRRTVFKDIHSVTGCTFAANVLEKTLGSEILKRLAFDETGSMNYEQFVSLLKGGDHVYEMVGDLALPLGKCIVKIRKMAKTVNFLIIYGGQAFSMGMKLGVPERFAQQIIDGVFAGYPRLGPWQKETIEEAKRQGYITTAFGTRKHVDPNILSRDGGLRARAERQTVNHKIQGCAADILKVVLTSAHHTHLYEETRSHLIAPVYDELVNSVPIDNVFEFVSRAQDLMNITPPGHPIPMLAEVSIGRNWYDAGNNELHDRPSQKKIEALFDAWAKEGWAA
jgi:DNA polymerase I-like protein with 3'-5' exonuclease and polymerase domains/5'-3' exonuclease